MLTRDFAPPRHREFAFIGEEPQDLNAIREKRKNCAKKSGRLDSGQVTHFEQVSEYLVRLFLGLLKYNFV